MSSGDGRSIDNASDDVAKNEHRPARHACGRVRSVLRSAVETHGNQLRAVHVQCLFDRVSDFRNHVACDVACRNHHSLREADGELEMSRGAASMASDISGRSQPAFRTKRRAETPGLPRSTHSLYHRNPNMGIRLRIMRRHDVRNWLQVLESVLCGPQCPASKR